MTSPRGDESAAERAASMLIVIAFWCAFACLGAGLGVWMSNYDSDRAALLMSAGLVSLMVLPTFRLVSALAAAHRERDRLTLASTLAVLAILLALTLRDALGMR